MANLSNGRYEIISAMGMPVGRFFAEDKSLNPKPIKGGQGVSGRDWSLVNHPNGTFEIKAQGAAVGLGMGGGQMDQLYAHLIPGGDMDAEWVIEEEPEGEMFTIHTRDGMYWGVEDAQSGGPDEKVIRCKQRRNSMEEKFIIRPADF